MPLPDDGPRAAREPVRRRRHVRPLRPRAGRSPRCWRAIPARSARCSTARCRRCRREPVGAAATTRRLPSQAEHERRVERCKEHIRAGDAFQIVLSQRAERRDRRLARSRSTARCAGSTRRRTSSCSSSTASRARRLVARDAREGRRHAGEPEPDRRHRPARATATPSGCSPREKDRAEHVMLVDLGRNDLSRVCVPGTVKVERFLEPERFSHVTHLVSEVAGELAPGVSPFDLLRATFPAGTVSGAPKVRAMQIISELEGYRRGPYAGVVVYTLPGRRRSTRASRSARSSCATDARCCRPAAASSPTATRAPSTRSACTSSPRSRPRSTWRRQAAERHADPAHRQLRLVHLQPRAPVRRARRRGDRAPERRDHGRRGGGARAVAPRHLPRPGPARGRGRDARDPRAALRARADPRRLPRAPGDRPGLRRRGRQRARARARQGDDRRARRPRHLRRPARRLPRRPLPLARGDVGARRASRSRRPRPTAR